MPNHTRDEINLGIRREIEQNVAFYGEHRDKIPQRLEELDQEWDVERAIEADAAIIGFAGVALSATRGRGWLLLPALVTGFLFQHAVQGWCPPVPVLRRRFRTSFEIDEERQALKALRGDYDGVSEGRRDPLQAVRA